MSTEPKLNKEENIFKVIIAALSDSHASAERTALKHAGIRNIQTYTSGVLLAEYLAKATITDFKRQEIIFCQNQLSDMTGINFFHLIRRHPLLVHQPIIGIASNEEEARILEKNGFEFVLIRPYTVKQLEKVSLQCAEFEKTKRAELLKKIQTTGQVPSSTLFFEALEDFNFQEKLSSDSTSAQTFLYDGLQLLKAGETEKAQAMLLKATVEEETAGQAYMALASIYRNSNLDLYEKSILHAMRIYALGGNEKKLLEVAELYKSVFPNAPHPLLAYISIFINKGKAFEAAKILAAMQKAYPMEHYLTSIARICQDSNNPEEVLAIFTDVLEGNYSDFVRKLKDKVEKEQVPMAKTLLGASKKKKKPVPEKQDDPEDYTGEFDFTIQDPMKMEWEDIPYVPRLDEEADAYDASINQKKQNQFWSIVKGTAMMYKNTRKRK